MTTPTFLIRQVYNFDVYPAALLGSNFKNVTVLALMDRDTANQNIDTQALHVQIYPLLPAGTPNSPDGYDYVKVKLASGETATLGIAWIKPDTVQLVDSRTITVQIAGASAVDVSRVRDALVQNGFSAINITIS